MNTDVLFQRALQLEFLSGEEGQLLFEHASTGELMYVANEIRKIHHLDNKVTWIIDRNVNTTNVCVANCKFCNFYRVPGHPELAVKVHARVPLGVAAALPSAQSLICAASK